MKIKSDFVTNSSSTCFLFAWSGKGKKSLYKLMEKYGNYFFLQTKYSDFTNDFKVVKNEISCNVNDVVAALKSISRKTKIVPIDKKIEEYLENIRTLKSYKNSRLNLYSKSLIYRTLSRIAVLTYAKESGISNVLEVCFGNNDGPFAGTEIGLIMDYEGRNIELLSNDLVILTEQRR